MLGTEAMPSSCDRARLTAAGRSARWLLDGVMEPLVLILRDDADVSIPEASITPRLFKNESTFIMNTQGLSQGLGKKVSGNTTKAIILRYKTVDEITVSDTPARVVHLVCLISSNDDECSWCLEKCLRISLQRCFT